MRNAKKSKPFDLNLKLLEAQKMSLNRTQLTISAPSLVNASPTNAPPMKPQVVLVTLHKYSKFDG